MGLSFGMSSAAIFIFFRLREHFLLFQQNIYTFSWEKKGNIIIQCKERWKCIKKWSVMGFKLGSRRLGIWVLNDNTFYRAIKIYLPKFSIWQKCIYACHLWSISSSFYARFFLPISLSQKIQSQNELEKSWAKHFRTKNVCVKCWWNGL